jgi:hypothetical protein
MTENAHFIRIDSTHPLATYTFTYTIHPACDRRFPANHRWLAREPGAEARRAPQGRRASGPPRRTFRGATSVRTSAYS